MAETIVLFTIGQSSTTFFALKLYDMVVVLSKNSDFST